MDGYIAQQKEKKTRLVQVNLGRENFKDYIQLSPFQFKLTFFSPQNNKRARML